MLLTEQFDYPKFDALVTRDKRSATQIAAALVITVQSLTNLRKGTYQPKYALWIRITREFPEMDGMRGKTKR